MSIFIHFVVKDGWSSGAVKRYLSFVSNVHINTMLTSEGCSTFQYRKKTNRRINILKYQFSKIYHELHIWYSSFVSVFEHAHPVEAEALHSNTDRQSQQTKIPDMLAKIGLHHLHAMLLC